MSAIEIRQELHDLINSADDKSLKDFYKLAIALLEKADEDRIPEEEGVGVEAEKSETNEKAKRSVSPLVESLTGVSEGDPDYRKEYREHLKKKYL